MNKNLLALFSYQLDANGYDYQRQDDVIIYYSLLDIKIFKKGNQIQFLEPKKHTIELEVSENTALIKKFHREQLKINKEFNDKKIELQNAFREIEKTHLKYWLNEDPYFFPSLQWPCNFDEKSITEWKEFKIDGNRLFVMYSSDEGWNIVSHAYEIDMNAKGDKRIINEF